MGYTHIKLTQHPYPSAKLSAWPREDICPSLLLPSHPSQPPSLLFTHSLSPAPPFPPSLDSCLSGNPWKSDRGLIRGPKLLAVHSSGRDRKLLSRQAEHRWYHMAISVLEEETAGQGPGWYGDCGQGGLERLYGEGGQEGGWQVGSGGYRRKGKGRVAMPKDL